MRKFLRDRDIEFLDDSHFSRCVHKLHTVDELETDKTIAIRTAGAGADQTRKANQAAGAEPTDEKQAHRTSKMQPKQTKYRMICGQCRQHITKKRQNVAESGANICRTLTTKDWYRI